MLKFNKYILLDPAEGENAVGGEGGGEEQAVVTGAEGAEGGAAVAEGDGEKTPVVAEGEETTVNFDDFLKTAEEGETEVKVEGGEKKDDKKVADAAGAKKETSKTLPTVAQPAAKTAPVARDYTGIPEADKPLFQRMSNEAYNKFAPIYKEYLALKPEVEKLKTDLQNKASVDGNKLPDSYYENPDAYVLSPEYNKQLSVANEAASVLEHWRSQLDAVRGGATEYQTLQRDPKTGQVVFGPMAKVDQRTQSLLEQTFFQMTTQFERANQRLGEVRNGFTASHQRAVADVSAFEKEFFKVYENDKHPLLPAIKDTLNKMNPVFRSSPLAPIVAKSIVTIDALTKLLQKQAAAGTKSPAQVRIQKAAVKAGPLATGAADGGVKKEDEVTIDDFEKLKNEG